MERDTFEPTQGITALPPDRALLSAILLSLGMVDRSKLETFIQTAIAVVDELDGDPEAEPEPDEANGDELDASAPEWHTLGKAKRNWRAADYMITMPELMHEDSEIGDWPEEDDPAGGNVEDTGEPEYPECPDRYHGENQTLIGSHRGDRFGAPAQSIDRWQRYSILTPD